MVTKVSREIKVHIPLDKSERMFPTWQMTTKTTELLGRPFQAGFFFRVIFIRFDVAVSNKSCTEEELNGESFMGQAWKKCQTALQLVMVRSRTVNTQEILLEKLTVFMVPILPRLLSRLEGKEKEDLQLHFAFRFLNLHKILFLIWPLKLCLKEMNVCNNIIEKLDQKTNDPKSVLGKLSLLHEGWDSHRNNQPMLLPVS